MRLAPNSADAWLATSQVRLLKERRTMAGAREAIERALALDSNNADVLHAAGVLAWYDDDAALAASLYHRALQVEPLRPVTLNNLGSLALFEGRYTEVLRWTDSVFAIAPEYSQARWRGFRLLALMHLGDTASARAEIDRWSSIPELQRLVPSISEVVAASQGDSVRLERIVAERLPDVVGASDPGFAVAVAYILADALAQRGASAATVLTVLESSPSRDAQLRAFLRARSFDRVRNEARFQRLWAETAP